MGTLEGSPWRLKIILMLFVFLTLLYGSYGVFGNIQTADEFNQNITDYTFNENAELGNGTLDENYNYDSSEGQSFIGLVTGFGSFVTFGEVDNGFARLMLNMVTTICFVSIGYIIYTFIRDWVPLV